MRAARSDEERKKLEDAYNKRTIVVGYKKVAGGIQRFVVDDLSNWYLRRSRELFGSPARLNTKANS